MSNLKEFYEKLSEDESVKDRVRELVGKKEQEFKDELIQTYINVAKESGITLTKEDFGGQSDVVKASGVCFLVDNGCFLGGTITEQGGCIVIGIR